MKYLVLGGSKNIGYYAAERLLASGSFVTFLLRKTNAFDDDITMKPYVASGKARLVQGDALKEEDVRRAWSTAARAEGDEGVVDACLFTVGGTPSFSITGGFILSPPDLCTRSMLNVLRTFPSTPQTKLVLISSTGLSESSHAALPLLMKPMYGYLLRGPHADKLGMERVVSHAAGWNWTDEEVSSEILPAQWGAGGPAAGSLKEVLVVRPAFLTDGEATEKYRAEDKDMPGAYTIRRRDVAHFIVEDGLKNWEKWGGKCVRIAY